MDILSLNKILHYGVTNSTNVHMVHQTSDTNHLQYIYLIAQVQFYTCIQRVRHFVYVAGKSGLICVHSTPVFCVPEDIIAIT